MEAHHSDGNHLYVEREDKGHHCFRPQKDGTSGLVYISDGEAPNASEQNEESAL